MGQSKLTTCYEALRYSLNPLVRVLIPFKKIRMFVRGNAYKLHIGIIDNSTNPLFRSLEFIQINVISFLG